MKTIYIIVIIVLVGLFMRECQKDPEIRTEIEYVEKTDTIHTSTIDTNYVPRYIYRTKTLQGRDSIVYVEKDAKTPMRAIRAKEFKAKIETDSSSADLTILTTGQLLDVQGTISYTQKQTTTYIRETKPQLFLYGQTTVKPVFESVGIGLDLTMRDMIIGVNASHYFSHDQTYVGVKVGFKIF